MRHWLKAMWAVTSGASAARPRGEGERAVERHREGLDGGKYGERLLCSGQFPAAEHYVERCG